MICAVPLKTHRCMACGAESSQAIHIAYYFCHVKYVRNSHRRKEQNVILCERCFRASPCIEVISNGRKLAFTPRLYKDKPRETGCLFCGQEAVQLDRVYAMLTYSHVVGYSADQFDLMAMVCGVCSENHDLHVCLPDIGRSESCDTTTANGGPRE